MELLRGQGASALMPTCGSREWAAGWLQRRREEAGDQEQQLRSGLQWHSTVHKQHMRGRACMRASCAVSRTQPLMMMPLHLQGGGREASEGSQWAGKQQQQWRRWG